MSALAVAYRTLTILTPEILILGVATAMMTAGAFVRLPRRTWALIAAGTLAAGLVALIAVWRLTTDPYGSVVQNDPLSVYGRLVFLLTGAILLAFAHDQVDDARAAEFFGALLMIDAGAMLVAAANELIVLFVALELVSLPTYLLLYLPQRNPSTREAATKYFFLSIFSSALLLFGLAYLYGLTGVSNLRALAYLIGHSPGAEPQPQIGLVALVFVMAGLAFRVAAVPLHFYAPDVYQGSPTVLAALLAWVPKGIGFVAMLRVLSWVLGGQGSIPDKGVMLAWVIAVLSMTLGNTVALLQENLKRLLAYSSVAHAGYLMIGVAVAFQNGPYSFGATQGGEGVLYYLVAYALMTLGTFGVILGLSTPERPVETVDDLAGLGATHPITALALSVCLFSLAGIPPLAGFFGKFFLFLAAIDAGTSDEATVFRLLALIAVLNSAIGAYYYLRIVVVMYFRKTRDPLTVRMAWPTAAAVGVCTVLTIVVGVTSRPVVNASRAAAIAGIAQPDPTLPMERSGGRPGGTTAPVPERAPQPQREASTNAPRSAGAS